MEELSRYLSKLIEILNKEGNAISVFVILIKWMLTPLAFVFLYIFRNKAKIEREKRKVADSYIIKILEEKNEFERELQKEKKLTAKYWLEKAKEDDSTATPALNRSSFQFRHNRHLLASFSLANG